MSTLILDRLFLRGFRNLPEVDQVFGPRFNVFYGDNGQGKTNLLEAIYYIGALKSFRGARRDDLIGHGSPGATLAARFLTQSAPTKAQLNLSRTRPRRISLDGKRPRSNAHWLNALSLVSFHPGDLGLATGSPELRRALLDRVLEQMDARFVSALTGYTKALRSRNRLLKTEGVDKRSILAFDELLATSGTVVAQSRIALAQDMKPHIEDAFAKVAGVELPLSVDYRSRVEPSADAMRAALSASLRKDLARGFTTEGPHADDWVFSSEGRPVRHFASQGQQRVLVLSVKMAELQVLRARLGRIPILLLDDLSSELSADKNRRLFEYLSGLGGQVFLSTTYRELIRLEGERRDFQVVSGVLSPS